MPDRLNIHALLPLDLGYSRSIARGLRSYIATQPGWRLLLSFQWVPRLIPRLRSLKIAGLLALVSNEEIADAVRELGLPTVNCSSRDFALRFPSVMADNERIGRLAAEHFLRLGFERFAFCTDNFLYSEQRGAGFRKGLAEAGYAPTVFTGTSAEESIRGLRPPVALFACTDNRAARMVQVCISMGLRVPEDVAVLGVDNDDLVCETSEVPLCSVDPAGERIGWTAGELLMRLIGGGAPPSEPILVPPAGVVTRSSTDASGVSDPLLARAMDFLRKHACEPMSVEDMMEQFDVSRRTLEMKFRQRFGRTLHDEIRRLRIERATHLLEWTDLPIIDIVHACGYSDVPRFATMFRKIVGMPPGRYRRSKRPGGQV